MSGNVSFVLRKLRDVTFCSPIKILGSLPQDAMQGFSNLRIARDKRTIII